MSYLTIKDVEKALKFIYPVDIAKMIAIYHGESAYQAYNIEDKIRILSMLISHLIQFCYVHPVQFKMVFNKYHHIRNIYYMYEIDDIDIDNEQFELMLTEIMKWNWDTVPFPEVTKLTVFTNMNGNTDVRGGGCGELEIPVEEFTWTVENLEGITLQQIVEGCYRMKGSKYDYSYELYNGIELNSLSDKHMILSVSYEYGS